MSELSEFLLKRRSVVVRNMAEPGPSSEDLEKILRAGMRVPDHGRLTPWRFIVIRGDARVKMGKILGEAFRKENPDCIDEQVEINAHYRGYLKKQKADILAFKRDENLIIPDKINYDGLSGLSNEVKAKFKEIKPKTMGQALRIDGITPAAVYILLSHVKRKSIKHIA